MYKTNTFNEWDKKEEKLSHENKSLKQHIKEVKDFLKEFLNFYNFPQKYFEIADYLAEFHDYGKLHKSWHMGSKRGHSHFSIKWLIENKKAFKPEKKLTYILWYLILKHHSSLLTSTMLKNIEIGRKSIPIKSVVKASEKISSKLHFEEKINLIDTFGLFKIADVCSAGAKLKWGKFRKPEVNENVVKRIMINGNKELDTKRWNEQLKLVNLPEFGLLRAPTGWGKTDVSLLFLKSKNILKVFYLFPTITAINKFYLKLSIAVGEKVSKFFYFYDTEVKEDLEKIQDLFFIENFLNPYVITTIDQFLLSFLQAGKYYRKRVMFRNSGIIIDEVHLLNPLMLYLLVHFLKKFREIYKFNVLFMSATLPNSLRKYLQKELYLRDESFLDFSKDYERKRRIMWEYIDDDLINYLEKAVDLFKKGKKVLIVVNTVKKAVEIGKKLETFGLRKGTDFLIFHARFMYVHRLKKEKIIENYRNKPHILVSTQVCEVSLDISYDFLFTELAIISSLIQRFGRVNRYGDKTNEVNVLIFKPKVKKKYPYSDEEIKIANEIIKSLQGEKLKNELAVLNEMNDVLTYEQLEKEIRDATNEVKIKYWEEYLNYFFSLDIRDEHLSRIIEYRNGLTTLIIPHPNCILDEKTKTYVKELLSKKFERLNWLQKRRLSASLKDVTVPVPIWWLRGIEVENKVLPVVNFNSKIYDKNYGFIDIRSG